MSQCLELGKTPFLMQLLGITPFLGSHLMNEIHFQIPISILFWPIDSERKKKPFICTVYLIAAVSLQVYFSFTFALTHTMHQIPFDFLFINGCGVEWSEKGSRLFAMDGDHVRDIAVPGGILVQNVPKSINDVISFQQVKFQKATSMRHSNLQGVGRKMLPSLNPLLLIGFQPSTTLL